MHSGQVAFWLLQTNFLRKIDGRDAFNSIIYGLNLVKIDVVRQSHDGEHVIVKEFLLLFLRSTATPGASYEWHYQGYFLLRLECAFQMDIIQASWLFYPDLLP